MICIANKTLVPNATFLFQPLGCHVVLALPRQSVILVLLHSLRKSAQLDFRKVRELCLGLLWLPRHRPLRIVEPKACTHVQGESLKVTRKLPGCGLHLFGQAKAFQRFIVHPVFHFHEEFLTRSVLASPCNRKTAVYMYMCVCAKISQAYVVSFAAEVLDQLVCSAISHRPLDLHPELGEDHSENLALYKISTIS